MRPSFLDQLNTQLLHDNKPKKVQVSFKPIKKAKEKESNTTKAKPQKPKQKTITYQ